MQSVDEYPGGWFGESWGASACEPERHKPTPEGEVCIDCGRAIKGDDRGMLIPYIGVSEMRLSAYHLNCFLRSIGSPALLDPPPQPIHNGVAWHIKVRNDDKYCIDVFRMIYNYRIVLSDPDHMMFAHGWCYFGHGERTDGTPRTMEDARLAAFAAAAVWDGYGSPPGFDKQAC